MTCFKFSDLQMVMVHDKRRIRLVFKSGKVVLADSLNVVDGQEGKYEECEFFGKNAYDEYYNPSVQTDAVQAQPETKQINKIQLVKL